MTPRWHLGRLRLAAWGKEEESQGGRSGSESPAGQQLLTRKLAAANCISQIPKLNLSDLARYCHQVSQPTDLEDLEDGYVRDVLLTPEPILQIVQNLGLKSRTELTP